MLSQGLGAGLSDTDPPGLALDWVRVREGAAGQDSKVRAPIGVPDGHVTDHLGADGAGRIC